jgi:type I restriction enzyme R subunit
MLDPISKPERATQDRIIQLFQQDLGYRYLGNLKDSENSNIRILDLRTNLLNRGWTSDHINKSLDQLAKHQLCHGRKLYDVNKAMYSLLRYGTPIKLAPGQPNETVPLIDWENPQNNDFALAEEVTVSGHREKRPDIVLYINGIALAVLELKNSRKELSEGIRQNLTNQDPEYIQDFFTTIQFCFAGNDSQGLRYGTIGTPAKYYLTWKEDEADNSGYKLDKYLTKICEKHRFLELIRDFILFDAGVKKLPRPHQYFAVRAARTFVQDRRNGIIWHTQGSGKSITMVLLAAWILEHISDARVLIVTDRTELDSQIAGVFQGSGTQAHQAQSIGDLQTRLADPSKRLITSLIHKFGQKGVDDFETYITALEQQQSRTVGSFFVFVDECHRTQYGRLHRAMKAFLPGAVFIGFTGTPLLKEDKATTQEVFGPYIHTYKFNEAVSDGVVLDLVYEARDIDQKLSSQDRIDDWFEAKTRGLNDYQQLELKKRWVTMKEVLSSKPRMEKIVQDIVYDFATRPRLMDGAGNAILVASSIYEACKYYELFQSTPFKGHCAIVTSYDPSHKDVVNEETGENTQTNKQYVYQIYTKLLQPVHRQGSKSKTEVYEDQAKKAFIEQPATMRLLIVVDKLLTGFDAPSCTYLYIDKTMQDHGLFQAICRVNRLDGDSKQFGFIVDYKDLFPKVESAVNVYTKPLATEDQDAEDTQIILESRLQKGKKKLDEALEAVELLCQPVPGNQTDLDYIHYFCGNTELAGDIQDKEQLRHTLYKEIATLVRTYATIADDLATAGYSPNQADHIKDRVLHYTHVREIIKHASGETIDLKTYEADMRHLLDTYIQAEDSRVISNFGGKPLIEIIQAHDLATGIQSLPESLQNNKEAAAETIENNVRSKIIKEHLLDPAFYQRISRLLDEIIQKRKQKAIEYAEYLQMIAQLIDQMKSSNSGTPDSLDTPGKVALYHNLGESETYAIEVHESVKASALYNWRGFKPKENKVRNAILSNLQEEDKDRIEEIFEIVKNQPEY